MLEREREDRDRAAVAAERLRIARELHDVVAHAMSVIAVQAGVGRHVIDTDVDAAREALGAIETTSRGSLIEMRRHARGAAPGRRGRRRCGRCPASPTSRPSSPRRGGRGWG